MQPRIRVSLIAALFLLVVVGAAGAEVDRVGTLIGAVWCNDGQGPGSAAAVTRVTLCQAEPRGFGPQACPAFVDRVLFEFSTENPAARGRVRVTVNHRDAAGNLLATFDGVGRIRKLRADVEVLLFESLAPGDRLQAVVRLPANVRTLEHNQCAAGSLAAVR